MKLDLGRNSLRLEIHLIETNAEGVCLELKAYRGLLKKKVARSKYAQAVVKQRIRGALRRAGGRCSVRK